MSKKQKHRTPAKKFKWNITFIGALRFSRKRSRRETVEKILTACVEAMLEPSIKVEPSRALKMFFAVHKISEQEFWENAQTDWRLKPEVSNKVLKILKLANYGGTIDNLWQSVFNMRKLNGPSGPSTMGKLSKAARRSKLASRSIQSAWVVGSGQSRKSGSHNS